MSIFRTLFVKADGSLKKTGDIIERPKLARTLSIIADDPLAFYNTSSQLAHDIIEDIAEYGSSFYMVAFPLPHRE